MAERLSRIESKARVFDPATVEALAGRLQKLDTQLGAVAAKRGDDALRLKTEELFAMIERWDGVAGQLPVIVDRLKALRAVHEVQEALTPAACGFAEMCGYL